MLTQREWFPLPLPMREATAFFVQEIPVNTLIDNFPFFFSALLILFLQASICE